MKNSILSKKESNLIETLILKYGILITSKQINSELSSNSIEYIHRFVSNLVKKGWLVRVKNGVFALSDLYNRGNTTLSQYTIANTIGEQSYVSFGFALQYCGMFDQLQDTISSVSLKQYSQRTVGDTKYTFISTKEKYFYGFKEVNLGKSNARIATAEKALIDYIQFSRTAMSTDLVIEKLRKYKNQIDFKTLNIYLLKSTTNVQRIFGFIFDILKIDSTELLKEVKKHNSTGCIDSKSDVFNAKWNLYINQIFTKYI
jgi:predicted transcriptional regulator of viral defense system